MSGAEGGAESQPAVGEGQLRAHTRKWWEGFPSIDEVCQARHGLCSRCAVKKEEQEECDLCILNSRDRGQELSLRDVFVVQGRGHIVRASEGVPRIWSPCALVGKAQLPVQMGAAGGVGCRRWMSVGSSPAAFHTLVLPRWRLMPACASRLA